MDRQWGDIDQVIRDTARRIAATRNEHIEGLIGAYLAHTGLSITEIMLVEHRCHDGMTRWYFAPRDELPRGL